MHTLRHCYATHMLESGVNIASLQVLPGAYQPVHDQSLPAHQRYQGRCAGFVGWNRGAIMRPSFEVADVLRAHLPDLPNQLFNVHHAQHKAVAGHYELPYGGLWVHIGWRCVRSVVI